MKSFSRPRPKQKEFASNGFWSLRACSAVAEGSRPLVETCCSWPSCLTGILVLKSLRGPDFGIGGRASSLLLHGSLVALTPLLHA